MFNPNDILPQEPPPLVSPLRISSLLLTLSRSGLLGRGLPTRYHHWHSERSGIEEWYRTNTFDLFEHIKQKESTPFSRRVNILSPLSVEALGVLLSKLFRFGLQSLQTLKPFTPVLSFEHET